ncbi:hypothetical protein [Mucilaginibacter sp. 22184]|uniref:hypothetical protein n=1 Tax=Mucilaginibacter sp. 22184 TaxID=3453887 RepID=UPI003F85C88E
MADIIPSFNDFQEVIEILEIIQSKIDIQTDIVWTRFNSAQDLTNELTDCIQKLRVGDHQTLKEVYMLFAPTGTFQELSISNGWSHEYLNLAHQFDVYYEKFKKDN